MSDTPKIVEEAVEDALLARINAQLTTDGITCQTLGFFSRETSETRTFPAIAVKSGLFARDGGPTAKKRAGNVTIQIETSGTDGADPDREQLIDLIASVRLAIVPAQISLPAPFDEWPCHVWEGQPGPTDLDESKNYAEIRLTTALCGE